MNERLVTVHGDALTLLAYIMDCSQQRVVTFGDRLRVSDVFRSVGERVAFCFLHGGTMSLAVAPFATKALHDRKQVICKLLAAAVIFLQVKSFF